MFKEAENIIDYFYQQGLNIGITVSNRYRCMYLIEYTLYIKNIRIFEYLAKYTDINEPNYDDSSLLYHIVLSWRLYESVILTPDILNAVLKYTHNVDKKFGAWGDTSLYKYVSLFKFDDITDEETLDIFKSNVTLFLKYGADPTIENGLGPSTINIVIGLKNIELLQLFIDNSKTDIKPAALYSAILNHNNYDAVEHLVNQMDNINYVYKGSTFLDLAKMNGYTHSAAMVELLEMAAGFQPRSRTCPRTSGR